MMAGRIVADYGQMVRVATDAGELFVNRPVNKHNNELQMAVGELLKTQSIREDDSRGSHTTSHRELIVLLEGD